MLPKRPGTLSLSLFLNKLKESKLWAVVLLSKIIPGVLEILLRETQVVLYTKYTEEDFF